MKVPISKQRLIFHGKLLIDNDNLLKYQVKNKIKYYKKIK